MAFNPMRELLLQCSYRHARGRFHKVLFPYRLMSLRSAFALPELSVPSRFELPVRRFLSVSVRVWCQASAVALFF